MAASNAGQTTQEKPKTEMAASNPSFASQFVLMAKCIYKLYVCRVSLEHA